MKKRVEEAWGRGNLQNSFAGALLFPSTSIFHLGNVVLLQGVGAFDVLSIRFVIVTAIGENARHVGNK